MKRTPLALGTKVGEEKQYVIDAVIGTGANCVVYDAHYIDKFGIAKAVKLKECYPVTARINRQENQLFWIIEQDRKDAFQRFEDSYRLSSEIQNSDLKNTAVYSMDFFDANGTKYIAMIPENGDSYDKVASDCLPDIIRTVLALSNAVGRYHDKGYLHLDVKPSNFIASSDLTGKGVNIALFDLDTLVLMKDLTEDKIKTITSSKGWSAPEQKMRQLTKLCPATDLYSVGAILFERIMNRSVENSDTSPYASWEFDLRFDARFVNPEVKKLISDVFHKTLAANVKKRFQTAKELSDALHEILRIFEEGKPYIVSNYPIVTNHFVGREDDLDCLHKLLVEKDIVFVSGFHGIGKSELVKRYAMIHADDYETIAFIQYEDSLEESLSKITIRNISEHDDHMDILRECCDKRTLLILDNFNVEVDAEPLLEHFLSLECKIIITSRTNFDDVFPEIGSMFVEELPTQLLFELFERESGVVLNEAEKKLISPLIPTAKSCTYYWTLLARARKAGDYSIKELVYKAVRGLKSFEDTERVLVSKDGVRRKRSVTQTIVELYNVEMLSDIEIDVIIILYYLQGLNLRKNHVRDIIQHKKAKNVARYMEALNFLLEIGVIYSWGGLHLSDTFFEVVEYELKPNFNDYGYIRDYIEEHLFISKEVIEKLDECDAASMDRVRYVFKCDFALISNTNLNESSARDYYVDLIYRMLGGKVWLVSFAQNDYANHVFKVISQNSKNPKSNIVSRIKSHIILLTVCVYQMSTSRDEFQDLNGTTLKYHFDQALGLLRTSINLECREQLVNDLCESIVQRIMDNRRLGERIPTEIIDEVISLQAELGLMDFKQFIENVDDSKKEKGFHEEDLAFAECHDSNVEFELMLVLQKISALLQGNQNVEKIIKEVYEYSIKRIDAEKLKLIDNNDNRKLDTVFWRMSSFLKNSGYGDKIFPYIIAFVEEIEKSLKAMDEYQERWMYDYYKLIIDYACAAKQCYIPESPKERLLWAIFGSEDEAIDQLVNYYNEFELAYKKKANAIIGAQFDL